MNSPALHWLVLVTERWRGRGEVVPGSNPRLMVPTVLKDWFGHDEEGWDEEEELEEDTEMME